MSTWQEISIKDVEIDGDELNIPIGEDEFGNHYITLNIEDLKELLGLQRTDNE